ncbi:hypothetical protein [Microcoleus sp. B4-D4]
MYVSKSLNQVQPIESRFFCAADLKLHTLNFTVCVRSSGGGDRT